MYKLPLLVTITTSFILTIYTLILFVKIEENKLVFAPRIFVLLNNIYSSIPYVREFLRFLKKSYFLVFQNKLKGEILAVATLTYYPLLSVICYSILSRFTSIWYLNIVNIIICFVFPLLMLKSIVVSQCVKVQMQMIKVYSSLAVLLTQNKMEDAITEVIRGSTGKSKIIMRKFKEYYETNRIEAYDYLVTTLGDNYTETVVYNLIQLEEYGTSPTEEILRICQHALEMHKVASIRKSKYNGVKFACVAIAIINFILNQFSNTLLLNLGNKVSGDSIVLYCSIALCFCCLLACFLFESN